MKFVMSNYGDYQSFIIKFAPLSGDFHYGSFTCGVLGNAPDAVILCVLSSQPASYATDHPLSLAISSFSEIS